MGKAIVVMAARCKLQESATNYQQLAEETMRTQAVAVAQHKQDLSQSTRVIQSFQRSLNDRKAQCTFLENELSNARSEGAEWETKYTAAAEALTDAKAHVQLHESVIQTMKQDIEALNKKVAQLTDALQVANSEIHESETTIHDQTIRLETLANEYEVAKAQVIACDAKKKENEETSVSWRQRVTEAETRNRQLQRKLVGMQDKVVSLNQNRQRERQEFKQTSSTHDLRVSKLRATVTSLSSQLEVQQNARLALSKEASHSLTLLQQSTLRMEGLERTAQENESLRIEMQKLREVNQVQSQIIAKLKAE